MTGEPQDSNTSPIGTGEAEPFAEPEVHRAAKVFRKMKPEEYRRLVADIKENGLQYPITLDPDGRILDGRHRLRACRELRVTPRFETYRGDPYKLVISRNLRRRNLTDRAAVVAAAKLANMQHGGDRRRGQAASRPLGQWTNKEAADELGVGAKLRSVRRARKVFEVGTPELQQAVEEDEKLSFATAEQIASLPAEEQREILSLPSKEISKAANAARQASKQQKKEKPAKETAREVAALPTERCDLVYGGVTTLLDEFPDSVVVTVMPPPHSKECLRLFEELSTTAAHALRIGGVLLCIIGQTHLPEILSQLGAVIDAAKMGIASADPDGVKPEQAAAHDRAVIGQELASQNKAADE